MWSTTGPMGALKYGSVCVDHNHAMGLSSDSPASPPSLHSALTPTGWADYASALDRVTTHIEAHVHEPLSLAALAEVACLSPHHFHRVYHAMRGETLAATVKRVRLQRAAWWLAHSSDAVDVIARRCGFSGAAALIRNFKDHYAATPAAYRRTGPHTVFRETKTTEPSQPTSALHVDMRNVAAQNLLVVPHRGPYIRIGQAFERTFMHAARQCHRLLGEPPQPLRTVGIYLDDPAAVSPSALRSYAGVALAQTARAVSWQAPLQTWQLPAGRCAVLRYQGPYASMQAAYRWLFGQWLPHSGHAPADHPVYEDYLNHPRDVPPAALLTDIYLPVV
jgi:AraC family transcriptional regulator